MTFDLWPGGPTELLPRRSPGFTLVEVLVVLVILGGLVAVAVPSLAAGRAMALQSACASNQRQIGSALILYAQEHGGEFPPTTHTTGSFRKDRSWIYELAPYLDDVDEVRICPADPPRRQAQIRRMNATSYVLNDLVFDSADFNRLVKIPVPSRTMLLAILNEARAPSVTRDHIHGAEWTSWAAALNDIEADRHRVGARARDRLRGAANYLFADGHVETISARDYREFFQRGINPAEPPGQ